MKCTNWIKTPVSGLDVSSKASERPMNVRLLSMNAN